MKKIVIDNCQDCPFLSYVNRMEICTFYKLLPENHGL